MNDMRVAKLIVSILASFLAGAVGSLVTISNISTWYAGLNKPTLNPPNFVFGPVWSLLYLMMGISLYLVWVGKNSKDKIFAYIIFAIQLVLNALWSVVFFGFHQFILSEIVIGLLVTFVIVNIISFYKFSKTAAYMLVPYLLWICFASYLTVGITILNLR
jgi:benzodiazapine receptor